MELGLQGKVIIVTGGARGIGEGISLVLSDEKAILCIVDRDEDDIQKLKKSLENTGASIHTVKAELSDPAACGFAVQSVVRAFGRIDGLVNNACLNNGTEKETASDEKFMRGLRENLLHYYLMTQYSLPYLKQSRGAIVNISEETTDAIQGGNSAPGASGGHHALTREWAVELVKYGIRVNSVIVPGNRATQYESRRHTLKNPDEKEKVSSSRIPLENRMITPFEIAHAVVFLLSEKSSHTTGQLFRVDGGSVYPALALTKA